MLFRSMRVGRTKTKPQKSVFDSFWAGMEATADAEETDGSDPEEGEGGGFGNWGRGNISLVGQPQQGITSPEKSDIGSGRGNRIDIPEVATTSTVQNWPGWSLRCPDHHQGQQKGNVPFHAR